MAWTYDVCELPVDGGGYQHPGGQDDQMRSNGQRDFQVIVTDPADPDFNPADVTAFDVMQAAALPVVNQTVWYKNGKFIPYIVCRSKSARRDNRKRSRWIVTTQWDSGNTNSICFTADGRSMFTCGKQGLQLWRCQFNSPQGEPSSCDMELQETIVDGPIRGFDFNEQRQQLAVRTERHYVQILDLKTRQKQICGPHVQVTRMRLTPDGRHLITATWQGFGIKVWDTRTGKEVTDLSPETSTATLAINEPGRQLLAVSGSSIMRWSLDDWSVIEDRVREKPDGWAGSASFDPTGNLFISAHSRYFPKLVDSRTGLNLAILESPVECAVGGVAWSSDGHFLAIANEGTIQVWDIAKIRERLSDIEIDWVD